MCKYSELVLSMLDPTNCAPTDDIVCVTCAYKFRLCMVEREVDILRFGKEVRQTRRCRRRYLNRSRRMCIESYEYD